MRIALTYNERRAALQGCTIDEHDAEFDTREAIESIARLARSLGHTVVPVDVTGSIPRLIARLSRIAPDLVLNLAEGERGAFREAFYPALFEQLGLRHTGSSASALAVCLDKALAKRVVASARVRVPRGTLVRSTGDPIACDLPVIVKPNFEGSSKGITAASLVTDCTTLKGRARLRDVVADVLARYPDGVLVEQYVPGIDVAVGWLDGGLLPPIWYRHDAGIYDYTLKHDVPERVCVEIPELADGVRRRLDVAATRAFDALGVTGYGRVDFRITPGGDVVFLEMNPLPSLTLATGHDELYVAAAHVGRTPRDVIAAVLAGRTSGAAEYGTSIVVVAWSRGG
jgi:D-alanine-D-alanine ligase